MKPRVLLAVACLALLPLSRTPDAAPAAPAAPEAAMLHERVLAYLRPLMDLEIFQGAILIARGDRVLLEEGFGPADIEHGVPNSPQSVFRIASLSKPITEVALGALVESGRLSLGDRLSKYLPDFPRAEEMTLDQIRNHQAGIPSLNSIPFDEESNVPNTLDSLIRVIAAHPLDYDPGARQRYSNGGYALLAKVIEEASGTDYASYVRLAVLEPLGMSHTRHEADGSIVRNRAVGTMASPDTRRGQVHAPFQQMMTKTGGGSLISTSGDLHRFLRAMDRDNVIRAATWRTLFPRDDSTLAFGGRCPGYNLYMERDFENDVDVVVLVNDYSCGMIADVAAAMRDLALGHPVKTPAWRVDLPADSVAGARAVGDYVAPAGQLPYGPGPFQLRWRNGGLVLELHGAPVDFLLPQTDGSYLCRNLWSALRVPEAGANPSPSISLRPLWFQKDAVACARVAGSPPAATAGSSGRR